MKNYKNILVVIVVLAIVGAGVYFFIKTKKELPQQEALVVANSNTKQAQTQLAETTVIYSEQISETNTSSRSWPTVRIMRKTGNGQPEILATVGKVGEYPSGFELSKDNKSIYINLESKLQKLDIATKKNVDIFTAKKQINSFVLSPDQSQIFVWDEEYASADQNYYLHVVNLNDLKDTILPNAGKLDDKGFFYAKKWRTDAKIILLQGAGEVGWAWSYDLSSGKLAKDPSGSNYEFLSESGQLMTTTELTIDDICNEFSGSSSSLFSIHDVVSGKVIASSLGQKGKSGSVVAFSPDDKQLIYSSEEPNKNKEACNTEPKKTYYLHDLSSGKETVLTDYVAQLKQWDLLTSGLNYQYDQKNSNSTIKLGDKALLGPTPSSGNSIQVIKVY